MGENTITSFLTTRYILICQKIEYKDETLRYWVKICKDFFVPQDEERFQSIKRIMKIKIIEVTKCKTVGFSYITIKFLFIKTIL